MKMIRFLYVLTSISVFSCITLIAQDIDYSQFEQLLKKHVHHNQVDYESLIVEKEKLLSFTRQLEKISPDSHPDLFKTRNEKLAYWINAYNAFILQIIVENYPVDSIKDINFIGFTVWLSKNTLGGESISFKALEDDIIRERFGDPRIHFSINCASASCPPLLDEAFVPDKLEQQLESTTANFINDPTNFYVDEGNGVIFMSSIFDWYEDDFISWLQKEQGIEDPGLLDYIRIYYKKEIPESMKQFDIKFYDYDWSLNDKS